MLQDYSTFIHLILGRKQLRVKLRENMEYNKLYESPPGAVTDFVKDVVSNVDDIDSLGSIDALNQAARRYNRKLMPQQAEMETGFP